MSSISTRLGAIKSDLVTIEELNIGDISTLVEIAKGTTNLQTIQGNLPKPAAKEPQPLTEMPKVIIKKVSFGKSTIDPKIEGLDIGASSLPGFTLTNVGTAENGVP